MEHGFTFDSSVMFGPNIGLASVTVGVETSLQNIYGTSTTVSNTTETGISCNVHGVKKGKGDGYDFSYQMAT